ncbi:MAG TPA: T9SS type A sorting domain-containing protein, partial [Ignavibacteriaceae bacterium]
DMPCSGNEIIIQTTDGVVVDTIDSRERDSGGLAALEESYAIADKLFYSGDLEGAKIIYQQIVAGPYTSEEKLFAYKKLYEIGEILKEDAAYFSALQNAFNSILSVETDTLLIKTYKQSSILCDVSKKEYLTAISKFDNIIQQNPNSEEASYAEIDIITTALNLDTTNSQLGKMGNGKYLVKGTSDYLTKLNDILQSKFGVNSEGKEQIIPKEYSLHQNYPNPFNPTTTIKFDIPKDGLVQLEVFDILGRRISTIFNEYKSAGSYEHQFDASSFASGVYVYKLQAGDFVSSKKMILLK